MNVNNFRKILTESKLGDYFVRMEDLAKLGFVFEDENMNEESSLILDAINSNFAKINKLSLDGNYTTQMSLEFLKDQAILFDLEPNPDYVYVPSKSAQRHIDFGEMTEAEQIKMISEGKI
jgi:hypothetical protein